MFGASSVECYAPEQPQVTVAMDVPDEEVNVVSSPESCSRNPSPEPVDGFGRLQTASITCFPVIKTSSSDETSDGKDVAGKATHHQKVAGGSTNFSISSILSRAEPTAKRNGFVGIQSSGHGILDVGLGGNADTAMLSR